MVFWLALAVLYAFLHSLVTMFDKIILRNKEIDPLSLSAYRFLANAAVAGAIVLSIGQAVFVDGSSFVAYIIPLGILYTITGLGYFFAVKAGDISEIVPVGQSMTILLAFALSVFVLNEIASVYDYAGTAAIILGSYFVLTNGRIEVPKMSKAFAFLTVWAVSLAIWGIFSKSAAASVHPSTLNLLMSSFAAISFVTLNSVTDFKRLVKVGRNIFSSRKLTLVMLLSSISATVGTFLLFTALTVGNASEVLPVSRSLPLFTVFLGWLVLKENHSKIRFLGSLAIVAGIFLIYI